MEIPYSILLYLYIGLVALFVLLAFFDLYHIARFGFVNGTTTTVTFVFLAVAALIFFISYTQLREIDWSEVITIDRPVMLTNT
jgi:hypothetical protein